MLQVDLRKLGRSRSGLITLNGFNYHCQQYPPELQDRLHFTHRFNAQTNYTELQGDF